MQNIMKRGQRKVVNIFILGCHSLYQLIFREEKVCFFFCYDISVISFDFLAGLYLSKVGKKNTFQMEK